MNEPGLSALLLASRALGRVHPPAGLDLLWRVRRRQDAALRLVDALVGPGQVVVDAGASVGLFTSRMGRLVGRGGRVHAFEPNPLRHDRLRALAGRGRPIVLHPVGLSSAPGDGRLWLPRVGGRTYAERAFVTTTEQGPMDAEPVDIRLATLDAELGADAARVAFIKCDVEGHEASVLAGAGETLARVRPAILVEVEERHTGRPLDEALSDLVPDGYAAWGVTAAGLRPVEDLDIERDHRAPLHAAGEATPGPDYVNDFLLLPQGRVVGSIFRRESGVGGARRPPLMTARSA
jgi:FkbM family methyltransferase